MFIAMHCAVFPTCVGMNRSLTGNMVTTISVPHMRGDEPVFNFIIAGH